MLDFTWFVGVVEDIDDPEMMDRVRVRVFSYHTDQKTYLPTSSLHWSVVMSPTTSASVSGVGESHGLVRGSWVCGVFMDGEDCQQPAVMFSLKGKPSEKISSKRGFSDPSGEFPRYLNEPDTNRLARNQNIDKTVVEKKNSSRVTGIQNITASWSEPGSPYGAQYPFNRVSESVSGHIHEVDDTPGKERIHSYHTSGSYTEVGPDGSRVEKVVKDRYQLVLGDDHIYVSGNVKVFVSGDSDIVVEGNARTHVKGNLDTDIDGNANFTAKGNMKFVATRIDWN
jgi:hypothetical protein